MVATLSKTRYASPKVKSIVKTITPEEAAFILEECNANNRPLRPGKVAQYANDMRNGSWMLNGEAIIFDENGDLADGQHRLNGVIVADVPVEFLLTMGVERESRLYLNMGGARNVRDARAFVGLGAIKNGATVDAISRIHVRIARTGEVVMSKIPSGGGSVPLTNADVVQWTSENLEAVTDAATLGRAVQVAVAGVSPAAAGYAKMWLDAVDAKASAEFFQLIIDGVRTGAGDPLVAMDRTIRDNRLRVEQQVAVMVMAWNAWRAGEQRSKFWSKTYATGADMPQPI